jgi:hypothetical protein
MYPETNTLPKQPYPVRSAAGMVDYLVCNMGGGGGGKIVKKKITTLKKKNFKAPFKFF